MGFCTKCGKSLQDGEICSCQQQAAPQQAAPQMTVPQMTVPQMTAPQKPAGPSVITELVDLAKGVFTSPAETIAAYTAKANIVMIAILIGGEAIVSMFIRLFRMLIANAEAAAKAKKSINDFSSLVDYASSYYSGKTKIYETGEIFAYMFKEILVVAASAAILALVIWLLVKAFDKVNVTYVQALAVASLASLVAIPEVVLSWVIGLTSVGFLDEIASCVNTFASVLGTAFLFMGIRALSKNDKKTPLVLAIAFVCVHFVCWIIGLMF